MRVAQGSKWLPVLEQFARAPEESNDGQDQVERQATKTTKHLAKVTGVAPGEKEKTMQYVTKNLSPLGTRDAKSRRAVREGGVFDVHGNPAKRDAKADALRLAQGAAQRKLEEDIKRLPTTMPEQLRSYM